MPLGCIYMMGEGIEGRWEWVGVGDEWEKGGRIADLYVKLNVSDWSVIHFKCQQSALNITEKGYSANECQLKAIWIYYVNDHKLSNQR